MRKFLIFLLLLTGFIFAADKVSAAPPQPANLSASCPLPGTTANMSWAAASGATSYNIFASTAGHTYDWSVCGPANFCIGPITATSYNLTSLTPGTGYQWYVASCNSTGCGNAATGPSFTCQTCDTSYKNDKFHVCYFDNMTPDTGLTLAQADESSLSSINYNWGGGIVGSTGRSDQVSAVWRGKINFAAGTYVFHTTSDDGVTLDLEGSGRIIDKWINQAPTTYDSSRITLSAGYRNVTLRYFENTGGATIKLWWDYTPPLSQPANLSASCNVSGTTGNLNWSAVSGATFYSVYAQTNDHTFDWTNACITPNFCQRVYAPSASFTTVPGSSYNWFVTAGNSSGESSALSGPAFTCIISCNSGISCSGSCSAPSNTCSANNGSRDGCIYTTYSGGGSCTPVAAPNQSCTTDNCSSGYSCISGICTAPIVITPATSCGTGTARATGLVSTPTLTGNFNTSGACTIDTKASFASYKIPTYEDLKSKYFTQAKTIAGVITKEAILTGDKNQGDVSLTAGSDHLYYVTGNLAINNNIPGGKSGVIFVDGNLTINPPSRQLTTGTDVGVVFVVGGNVTIDTSVTRVDAVIISQGTIYTAETGCSLHPAPGTDTQLIINGSLVSLDPGSIKFCRRLVDDSQPAEKINNQPKYLVILRDLMSDTLQKWSEIQ